ncbi:hypothetical protein [Streptomyces bacillaris]|uniref:hypothetical protein n=1 Tax=Streptomyces bacillaris TaxID=68179 RepID=UPI0037FEB02A
MNEDQAPALGDVRRMAAGDVLVFRPSARSRPDFPRLWEAAGAASMRGAWVHWTAVDVDG